MFKSPVWGRVANRPYPLPPEPAADAGECAAARAEKGSAARVLRRATRAAGREVKQLRKRLV